MLHCHPWITYFRFHINLLVFSGPQTTEYLGRLFRWDCGPGKSTLKFLKDTYFLHSRHIWALLKGKDRTIFTVRLHVMQRTVFPMPFYPSVCPSVCLFVCLSNAWIVTKRKQLVPTFVYHMKDHSSCFLTRRMVGGGDPFHLKFWCKLTVLERKRQFSIDIRSQRLAVTPSEKRSINTNRKSTTSFPMSLRWTAYVAPKLPKRVLKNAKCPKFKQ